MTENRRRRYLINARFQIKWTLIITMAGTLSSGLFALALWYSIERQNTLLHALVQADLLLKEESQDLVAHLAFLVERSDEEKERFLKRYDQIEERYAASREAKETFIHSNEKVKYFVVVFVVVIAICLFTWGIFLTHRVAGPLYVIRDQLHRLAAEGKVATRALRKGDEFKDDYEAIRRSLESLSSR